MTGILVGGNTTQPAKVRMRSIMMSIAIVIPLNILSSTCGIIESIHDAVRDIHDQLRVVCYES
jgi:hypothetical protein